MEIINQILGEINNYDTYTEHPERTSVLQAHNNRIALKAREYGDVQLDVDLSYRHLSRIKPSGLSIFISDMFREPDSSARVRRKHVQAKVRA